MAKQGIPCSWHQIKYLLLIFLLAYNTWNRRGVVPFSDDNLLDDDNGIQAAFREMKLDDKENFSQQQPNWSDPDEKELRKFLESNIKLVDGAPSVGAVAAQEDLPPDIASRASSPSHGEESSSATPEITNDDTVVGKTKASVNPVSYTHLTLPTKA